MFYFFEKKKTRHYFLNYCWYNSDSLHSFSSFCLRKSSACARNAVPTFASLFALAQAELLRKQKPCAKVAWLIRSQVKTPTVQPVGRTNRKAMLAQEESTSARRSTCKSQEYKQTEDKSNFFKSKKRKKNYTSYSKLSEIKLITIGISSPLRILQWAEKTLPNGKIYGEVLNANTLHHKTFKPQKGGLFCERIFGPLKDFECACGKVDKSVKKLAFVSSFSKKDSSAANTLEKSSSKGTEKYTLEPTLKNNLVNQALNSFHSPLPYGAKSALGQAELLDTKEQATASVGKADIALASAKSKSQKEKIGLTSASLEQQDFSSRKYCPDCDVEYTWSVIRRYQLGYIKLSSPVTHIWFLKGTPSYLSLLLDMKKRNLQFVTYCSETLTIEKSSLPFYTNNDSFFETLSSFSQTATFMQESKESGILKSKETFTTTNKQNLNFEASNKKETYNEVPSASKSIRCLKKREAGSLLSSEILPPAKEVGTLEERKRKKLKKPIPKKGWSLYTLKNKNKEITFKQGATILSTFLSSIYYNKSLKKYNFNVFYPLTLKKNEASYYDFSTHFQQRGDRKRVFETGVRAGLALSYPHALQLSKVDPNLHKLKQEEKVSSPKRLLFPDGTALCFIEAKQRGKGKKKEITMFFKGNQSAGYRKEKTRGKLFPKIVSFAKKLPLDIYILFSLERFLHKSSIRLSIKKAWETLYKQAFIKTINKSKKIFNNFTTLNKNHLDWLSILFISENTLKKHLTFTSAKAMLARVPAFSSNAVGNYTSQKPSKGTPMVRSEGKKQVQNFYKDTLNQQNYNISSLFASAKALKTILNVLQKIKIKYNLHILKSLQNLKHPIFSLNYTTQFLKQNSFVELENKIAVEIEKIIIKNSKYIQQSLTNSFLKFFVIDILFRFYKPKAFFCLLSLFSSKLLQFLTNRGLLTLQKCASVSNGPQGKIKNILMSYKNYLSLPFGIRYLHFPSPSAHLPQAKARFSKENVRSPKRLLVPLDFTLLNLTQLDTESVKLGKVGSSKSTVSVKLSKSILDVKQRDGTAQCFVEAKQRAKMLREKNHDYKKKKKKLYNNIYTLSHREPWDNDKEWQLFSLYSFGVKEYTDFPIYTYKKNLYSVTQYGDFSYLQTDSKKSNSNVKALLVSKGEIEVKQSSSFYSGAGIVQQLLNELDFYEIKKLDKQNRLLLYQINKDILKLKKKIQTSVYNKKLQTKLKKLKKLCKKRDLLIRRTKLVRKIFRKSTNPSSMVLTIIPVLPPDLRPIVKMGNQIAASDLNRLYQRVIYRNDRLKKFLKDPATSQSYEMKYAQRLLQEAVDNLMQNGKSGPNSEKDGRGRALKSLSDILKGKQGRFRQFLLGKRVDYSGRSVIVVGPKLKLYECGLPVEMAKELYLPFLLKRILNKNYAKTVVGAKTLIQNNPSLANELLREIMQVSPVLLNRAPTLHRLGIQAFIPKLIEGRAILLHPLVCSAFNADFDGDQMAVHVPITIEARAEAWKMMLSINNIFSPATGDPLAIPSQDMVLGCYYLTTFANKSIKKSKNLIGSGLYFKNFNDVIKLYDQQLLDIHALVWVNFGNSYPSSFSSLAHSNFQRKTGSSCALGCAFLQRRKALTKQRSIAFGDTPKVCSRWNKQAKARLPLADAKGTSAIQNTKPNASHTEDIQEDKRANKKAIITRAPLIQNLELIENENDQEDLFEIRISPRGQWQEISSSSHKLYDVDHNLISQYMCTTPGRILFNLIIQKTINKE